MRIQALFFASLKDEVGEDSLTLEVAESGDLDALFDALANHVRPPALAALQRENVRLAVNQQIVTARLALVADDEVAFLPPVTGG